MPATERRGRMLDRAGRGDFDNLVKLLVNVMDAFTVAFFLNDGEKGFRIFSWFSLGDTVNPEASFQPGQGIIGWVAKELKPITVKEFSHDTATLKMYSAQENLKSFMAAPVMHGERLVGVLTVDSKRQYVFTEKHQKILQDFAAVFAQETVRHEERWALWHEAGSLEAIQEVVHEMASAERMVHIVSALYNNIGRLVPNEKFIFALKASEEGVFHILARQEGMGDDLRKIPLNMERSLMGWVIRNDQPLNHYITNESRQEFELDGGALREYRSFLGVPMVVRKHVIGALGVLSTGEKAFSAADLRILEILASVAASYVAGAYAYGISLISRKVDSLTGLGNYLYLNEKVEKLAGQAGALLALDIRNFSRITNDFSVSAADNALVEMAHFFKRVVGKGGYVTRYYGDVFLIFLKDHSRDEAQVAAGKLLELLQAKNFFIDEKKVVFEGNIGIACYPDDGKSGNELIKHSFGALKNARKNAQTVAAWSGNMKGNA